LHLLSSFTDDIGLRREPKGSALPKFPSSVSDGGWFRGYTGSLLRCGLSSCSPPCTDLTRNFPQPTGTFTPELPASRSPFSSSGITTVAPERLHRWDFHPLERQLASLHRLFHPLHSCRFIPAHINPDYTHWLIVGTMACRSASSSPTLRERGSAGLSKSILATEEFQKSALFLLMEQRHSGIS